MKNKYQTFESYLEEVCPDTGRGGADGAQKAYEYWMDNVDVSDIMEYAERWGKLMYLQGERDSLAETIEKINTKSKSSTTCHDKDLTDMLQGMNPNN